MKRPGVAYRPNEALCLGGFPALPYFFCPFSISSCATARRAMGTW